MSESKHTPGPWVVEYSRDYYRRDRPIGINAPNDAGVPGAVGHIVRRNGIGLPSSDRAKANARLIAAAPDLLSACEAMLLDYESQFGMNYCECDSSVGLTCNACRTRAAINKAVYG
jgi:hypothetical protein